MWKWGEKNSWVISLQYTPGLFIMTSFPVVILECLYNCKSVIDSNIISFSTLNGPAPSRLNLSRIMIFNVHTWLPVTLFNLWTDQEIYWFNYRADDKRTEERRGKKGQHIFENVNLNNVFWLCLGREGGRERRGGGGGRKKPLSNAIWLRWHVALCLFLRRRRE